MNKVIVCGGRDFEDREAVFRFLDEVYDDWDEIIVGGARGADSLAEEWAFLRGVDCRVFPAEWEVFGAAAGPIRNTQMLKEGPTLVVAFPGGRGTKHMVDIALHARVKVVRFEEQGELF